MIIIWAVLLIAFIVIEDATTQLVSIWFVIGSVAALITALCNGNLVLQIILFICVSVIALIVTRPLVKKFVHPKTEKTNYNRCEGEIGIVVLPIEKNKVGQVKVLGRVWSAKSIDDNSFDVGDEVVVDHIEGVKLIIKKKSN